MPTLSSLHELSGRSQKYPQLLAIAAAAACLSLFAAPSLVCAQYDPPANYYSGVNTNLDFSIAANVATLRINIHDSMCRDYYTANSTAPVYRSYDDARQGLGVVDATSVGASTIYLCYTGAINSGTWDSAATWNREHSWPQSFGMSSGTRQYSDLHLLRACATAVNGARGNTAFGDASGQYNPNKGGPNWEERGDMARAMFYADVRYDGTDHTVNNVRDGSDLQLKDLQSGNPSTGQPFMGDKASLLRWNYIDPPSQKERLREQLVFDKTLNPSHYQGNRSAFVDHPEWVWAVFGGGNNNSELYVGGSAAADGSSSANVNLGRVMVGQSLGTQTVNVNKANTNPTYFDVTTGGNAVVASAAGSLSVGGVRQQAFVETVSGSTLTRPMVVGLNASTSTSGLKSGTITIDNTDITTGGTGMGSADGNDTVNVSAAVLDNRTLVASNVDYGRINPNRDYTAYSRITTSGDDDHNTRVTASAAAVGNANVTLSAAPASKTFTSSSDLMLREVSSRFAAMGSYFGNINLPVTGEGLAGESVKALSMAYHAEVVDPNGRPGSGDDYTGSEPGSDQIFIDFGTVDLTTQLSRNALVVPFGLLNNDGSAITIDPASIQALGDDAELTTNLDDLHGLISGDSSAIFAALNPDRYGDLNATYLISGGADGDVVIHLSATVVPEPTSLAALATAGGLLLAGRRRHGGR